MIPFWYFYCSVIATMVVPIWASPIGNCSIQCPPNEIYKECNGASCAERTCDRLNGPICFIAGCFPGCGCLDGYMRVTQGGPCVLPQNCPNNCPKNEVYIPECYTDCIQEPTCINPDPPLPNLLPQTCTFVGCGRCTCPPGYIRFGPKARCIRRNQCPRNCRNPYVEYQQCGSNCGRDCISVRNPNRACTLECREGCFCRPPYVLNGQTQLCVSPQNCPKQCDM